MAVRSMSEDCPATRSLPSNDVTQTFGELAQLGERLVCNQEVTGSSPVFSTSLRRRRGFGWQASDESARQTRRVECADSFEAHGGACAERSGPEWSEAQVPASEREGSEGRSSSDDL